MKLGGYGSTIIAYRMYSGVLREGMNPRSENRLDPHRPTFSAKTPGASGRLVRRRLKEFFTPAKTIRADLHLSPTAMGAGG